ncbi:hypothetical protein MELA_01376 [Candidatus Methylomirabilis lanthanidiphila]|uniref:Mercuric transport protein MerT n=1 Tax=Candidatus Methylomirabilis lanthanidiphila TaxID=2211376 RepID=A0A564ZI37_9BACT|nr:hypothetical protein [Candidatus Methylomirabilis lanthanidiphila]VUZ85001.1 hypothetical protein MELA_01376 [Candidatus Methylomirabilis lanthanidiphila]
MSVSDVKPGFLGVVAAGVSSLCCLLPLMVIVLGLGSGAFMMTTMQYRAIFIPAGIVGVAIGWLLYLRERKRCSSLACRVVGGTLNLSLLLLATVLVAAAVALDQFPNVTADLLMRATSGTSDTAPASASTADHSAMGHEGDMK